MRSFFGKGFVILLGLGLFVVFLASTGKIDGISAALGEVAGIAATNDPAAVDVATKAVTEAKLPTADELRFQVSVTAALAQLTQLKTTSGHSDGFATKKFGPRWVDVDRNGCDTRSDILARDLDQLTKDGCTVKTGQLNDPYTGAVLAYAGANVSVDRMVSLSDAWQSGAASWDAVHLAEFANDPLNLRAVDAAAAKARAGAAIDVWTPANTGFLCDFVGNQISVKSKYKLSVTVAEAARAAQILNTCASKK